MVGMRAAQVAKVLLTLGPRARMIAESARRAGMKPANIFEFEQSEPIMDWLNKNLTSNDAVLIKGSHGLRMDRITAALEIQS
jgi:UDP-N-acetylmuramoyl-tripeptide--D-alanyl-D-alanine ligase